jgi:hypothetical protein
MHWYIKWIPFRFLYLATRPHLREKYASPIIAIGNRRASFTRLICDTHLVATELLDTIPPKTRTEALTRHVGVSAYLGPMGRGI